MKKNLRNVFSILLGRNLNKYNFNKFLIIFFVGFFSRVLIGHFYSVNVYLYSFNVVCISYYICLSAFIILVHEFVNYFDFNIIPSFKLSRIKEGIKVFYFYGLNNKMFMDSNVGAQQEMKPYGKRGLSDKGSYRFRPVKSSPLSNTPITPTNINEMKPIREIIFNGKTNTSLRPVNFNHSATSHKASAKYLAFQERNKNILKYKDEFKDFYTTYRESIKLSDYELESLNIKMAIGEEKGYDT
jgi:hypothetical protein